MDKLRWLSADRLANWKWLNHIELPLCRFINRWVSIRPICALFAFATRMGNGIFWYALCALLPMIDPENGWRVSLMMIIAGSIGLAIYKGLKYLTHRVRPFIASTQIKSPVEPLDFYSFPSGHTLHAVGLTHIIVINYPPVALGLWTFAVLISLSRIGLGHHYPSDVAIGGGIGWAVSSSVLSFSHI